MQATTIRRSRAVLVAGALSLAAGALGVHQAAPAGASGAGLHLVSAETSINSTNSKSITVFCPSGEYVAGTGGQVSIANSGKAALVSITPLPNLAGVTAVAAEVGGGTAANWSVKAYATCVQPAFGIYRAKVDSPINSMNKAVTATCPTNWKVIGTGATVSTPDAGRVFINAIKPASDLKSVTAIGAEIGKGTESNWYVTAYALCVAPGTVSGLQLVSNDTLANSSHDKSAIMFCPGGTRVVGAAGSLTTPAGKRVILDEITPFPNLAGVTVVASETAGGTSASWKATTHAICAAL